MASPSSGSSPCGGSRLSGHAGESGLPPSSHAFRRTGSTSLPSAAYLLLTCKTGTSSERAVRSAASHAGIDALAPAMHRLLSGSMNPICMSIIRSAVRAGSNAMPSFLSLLRKPMAWRFPRQGFPYKKSTQRGSSTAKKARFVAANRPKKRPTSSARSLRSSGNTFRTVAS